MSREREKIHLKMDSIVVIDGCEYRVSHLLVPVRQGRMLPPGPDEIAYLESCAAKVSGWNPVPAHYERARPYASLSAAEKQKVCDQYRGSELYPRLSTNWWQKGR